MERTKLAAARYEKGWSQEEVAERVGVTRNTFSKWERGIVAPYPLHVYRLCEVYRKSASELDLVYKARRKSVKAEASQIPQDASLEPGPRLQGDYWFVESHSPDFSHASVANLATITQQFRAMQRRGDVFITNGVHSHIQTIQEALEQTVNDSIRRELWRVLAQTQTVAGFNPIKKTEQGRAKTFLEAAIASAQNSGDTLLTGASLGHLAQFTLREEHNLIRAVQLLSRAQEYVQKAHPLNGWFALVMASIAAKEGHKQQCETYLTEAMTVAHHLPPPPDTTDLYFTDFSLTSVHIYTINCWLTIGDAKRAHTHLAEVNLEDVADNRRASAFCDASKACMMVDEFEMAQRFAFQAIDKAASTQQRYVIPRCMALAQTIERKAPDTPYAVAITEYARLALQQR